MKTISLTLISLSFFFSIFSGQTVTDFALPNGFKTCAIDSNLIIHSAFSLKNSDNDTRLYYGKLNSNAEPIGDLLEFSASSTIQHLGEIESNGEITLITWQNIYTTDYSSVSAQIIAHESLLAGDTLYGSSDAVFAPQPVILGDSLLAVCWSYFDNKNGIKFSLFDTSFNYVVKDAGLIAELSSEQSVSMPGFLFQPALNRLLLVWADNRDGVWRVYGRFLNSRGALLEDEFLISDTLSMDKVFHLRIDANAEGDFAAVWSAEVNGEWHVYWRILKKDLSSKGEITDLNEAPGNVLEYSGVDIALSDSGNVFVVWEQEQEEKLYKIYGQRYSNYTEPFGNTFRVSTASDSSDQFWPQTDFMGNLLFTHWSQSDTIRMANFLDFNNPYLSINGQEIPNANQFELSQNYPNPFNPSTTIAYKLRSPAHVTLEIYDALGRKVKMLYEGDRLAGSYVTRWNGKDQSGAAVASGLYFYRLRAGSFTQTRKMLLLK